MSRSDREAELRVLVEARWAALVRFGYLLTGDRGHAEDLVQAALEKCWPKWRSIRSDSPERYIRAAMANLAASQWRRKRHREVPLEDAGHGPSHAGPADGHAVRDEVWQLLQSLPPRMRAVVVLRWVEDLSEAQTAQMLGCSVGSVKSQSSRALARLREQLTIEEASRR
ncbi:MAG TPA: SigE family RNA polymerase sigma factor [Actinomycetales bacterium]|nr:SigE family RNA polymerase sigma factor [Actinomycetales bacterium]